MSGARLLGLVSALSFAGCFSTLPAQNTVGFAVVIKTGDPIIDPDPTGAGNTGPIVDLGRGPSINDAGKVAFIARDQPGLYGRVILDASGVIKPVDGERHRHSISTRVDGSTPLLQRHEQAPVLG